jgi:hypothetical protein
VTPPDSPPPRLRSLEGVTAAALAVGCVWALVQLGYTVVALEVGEDPARPCTLDQPHMAQAVVTALTCAAAATALGLAVSRRPRPALAAIGVEAVLALIWIALGGWDLGCVVASRAV